MTNLPKNLSSFGEAAVALDGEFQALEEIAREMERLTIESDKGLERGLQLLQEADGIRQRMTTSMQALAQTLEEARDRNEKAATIVAERAEQLQKRQRDSDLMLERYRALGELVKKAGEAIAQVKQPSTAELPPEQRALLMSKLPAFNDQLGILVDQARELMADAHAANMKNLERNVDSLRQSIQAARHRLNLFVGKQGGPVDPPSPH